MRHVVSEPVFLILASLADQPRHGYAILQEIESLSAGRVKMSTGTLYGAVRRMLEDDWIAPHSQRDTSREKRAYRLTSAGRKILREELDRMKQLMRAATARLKEA
jgi:DNA-binding PadR family transcriptional regulator